MERGICPTAPLDPNLDLDPFKSRDVIGHVTTGTTHGPFLLVVCWHQVTISHGWWDITRHNLDNNIPIVNTLETNFGDLGDRDYAIFQ